MECSIDKTWFRVARILLHVRLTQRPLKFHGKLNVVSFPSYIGSTVYFGLDVNLDFWGSRSDVFFFIKTNLSPKNRLLVNLQAKRVKHI